jgi:hypothetical protein
LVDETVVKRIIEYVGLPLGITRGRNGKNDLMRRIPNYNQAARFDPWLIVIDLDQDSECAPDFVRDKLPPAAGKMRFRMAVRAIEAWLLADREHIAKFLQISTTNIPRNPDTEANPKTTLVNLARRSRKTSLREDMIPRQGSHWQTGPGYTGLLIEFVRSSKTSWRPDVAVQHSDSLRRCIEALQVWKSEGLA